MSELHSIEEMQRAGCTTARGIRFWEEQGLLGQVDRAPNNARKFTDEQFRRAKVIAAAQFGGFALDDIRAMLDAYDAEVYEALTIRLADQMRAAARLAENLPRPATMTEYDL